MEKDTSLQFTLKLLRDISEGVSNHEIVVLSTKGIQLVQARKGFLLCNYIIPNSVSDEHGNWQAGAIATLIDNVGSLATYSLVPAFNVTVDFSISFFLAAKVQEEVEVEAKVVGKKERLTCVVVQVRKKGNGDLIALGKQWMAAANINARNQTRLFEDLVCSYVCETKMKGSSLQKGLKLWLRGLSNGTIGHEVEALITKYTRVVKDENGNCHAGAIATLVDTFGSLTGYSITLCDSTTVDFTISYYSTARVQEEIELETKVVGKKERLISVAVEVRKKENGELVGLGKQWIAAANSSANHHASKLQFVLGFIESLLSFLLHIHEGLICFS